MRKIASLLLLLAALLAACASPSPTVTAPKDAVATVPPENNEITAMVEDFGLQLQQVSLLAPDAADQLAQHYGSFVTSELLQAWQADPQQAPGRLTSSPYPDHIQVLLVEKQGSGYLVQAVVAQADSESQNSDNMLSGYPIELRVVQQDGQWVIAEYKQGEP